MPKILVLEDMVERVSWLREEFQDEPVTIEWYTTVQEFLSHLASDVACIVLDHDVPYLGDLPEGTIVTASHLSLDVNGQNGTDAAKALASMQQWSHIPVLIWSVNPLGSSTMRHILTSNGYTRVTGVPFNLKPGTKDQMAAFLRNAVYG